MMRRGLRMCALALAAAPWSVSLEAPAATFSPDSEHVAYGAKRVHAGALIVVDGIEAERRNAYDSLEQPSYHQVGAPVFSPDGKHLAYWAVRDGKQVLVLDGQEGPEFDFSSPDLNQDGIPVGAGDAVGDGVDTAGQVAQAQQETTSPVLGLDSGNDVVIDDGDNRVVTVATSIYRAHMRGGVSTVVSLTDVATNATLGTCVALGATQVTCSISVPLGTHVRLSAQAYMHAWEPKFKRCSNVPVILYDSVLSCPDNSSVRQLSNGHLGSCYAMVSDNLQFGVWFNASAGIVILDPCSYDP